MIHDVASSAAAKSSVPFDLGAVVALEEALEPMLEALCAAALTHAASMGRESIDEEWTPASPHPPSPSTPLTHLA